MIVSGIDYSSFRYEYKYKLEGMSRHSLEQMLHLHPMCFFKPYPMREINNIYLDSPEMSHYFQNVIGVCDRMKVRVRWYGALMGRVENPVLEFKIKRGLISGKVSFPLAPFTMDHGFSHRVLEDVFRRSDLPHEVRLHLGNLGYTLLNHYRRNYYESRDRRFRMTVDYDLVFYNLSLHRNAFLERHEDHESVILELKFAREYDAQAQEVTRHLPFRITKSSKYVSGIDTTSGW